MMGKAQQPSMSDRLLTDEGIEKAIGTKLPRSSQGTMEILPFLVSLAQLRTLVKTQRDLTRQEMVEEIEKRLIWGKVKFITEDGDKEVDMRCLYPEDVEELKRKLPKKPFSLGSVDETGDNR